MKAVSMVPIMTLVPDRARILFGFEHQRDIHHVVWRPFCVHSVLFELTGIDGLEERLQEVIGY